VISAASLKPAQALHGAEGALAEEALAVGMAELVLHVDDEQRRPLGVERK